MHWRIKTSKFGVSYQRELIPAIRSFDFGVPVYAISMTKLATSFQVSVSITRPQGAWSIGVYCFETSRCLQCFNEFAFSSGVCREVNPSVQWYCKPPAHLDLKKGKIRVDYWVKEDDRE